MKIIQLVETASSATQLKSAFNREEWCRIILHFAAQRNINLGTNDNGIRSALGVAFRMIGPEMDNVTVVDDWNSRAVSYGANLPNSSGLAWPAIYNHLAPHRTAEVPERFSSFDISRPPGSRLTGFRADVDRTEETVAQVSSWAQGPAEMNREQARTYFADWVAALRQNRDEEWMNKLLQTVEGRNTRLRRFHRIQEQLIPQDDATVQKSVIDRSLYSWLTSSDISFYR